MYLQTARVNAPNYGALFAWQGAPWQETVRRLIPAYIYFTYLLTYLHPILHSKTVLENHSNTSDFTLLKKTGELNCFVVSRNKFA